METLITVGVDALIYAAWLFIVSLGLTLVFGVMNVLNLAHGSLYALGAYMATSFVPPWFDAGLSAQWSPLAMVAAALCVAVVMGPLIERGVLRRFYGRDEVSIVLVTYALMLILDDTIKLVWGVYPRFANQPYGAFGNLELGRLSYVGYDLGLLVVALLAGAAVWFGLHRTRPGKLVMVVIEDREVARAMGIKVGLVNAAAFTIGAFLAALGGALTAPMISVAPGVGINVILLSFAVVVIGGLGSVEGAALGALIVGLARASTVHFLPEAELFAVYLVMTVVLVFRPQGLIARTQARKI
jgi:branched-chain amino acid transport system permease protein